MNLRSDIKLHLYAAYGCACATSPLVDDPEDEAELDALRVTIRSAIDAIMAYNEGEPETDA